jgi:hypothetical protein
MNSQEITCKIVVTGGPGGGKTTALDLFQRELATKVKIVPEAASLLFKCGLSREVELERRKIFQQSIYKMQITLEEIFHHTYQDRVLICDRGTLDGLVYWPNSEKSYFDAISSNIQNELNRYRAVIFFQTAAAYKEDVKSNNPFRTEDEKLATELDLKLKNVWEKHPNFHYIPANFSFMSKITDGLNTIHKVIKDLNIKPCI